MSFLLTIHDRNGYELQLGDKVKIINSSAYIQFFSEVKWLADEQALAPFHTFAFHSIEKIDKLPEGVIKSSETRYDIWYLNDGIEDDSFDKHERYLTEWRECEHWLNIKIFRIKLNPQLNLFS